MILDFWHGLSRYMIRPWKDRLPAHEGSVPHQTKKSILDLGALPGGHVTVGQGQGEQPQGQNLSRNFWGVFLDLDHAEEQIDPGNEIMERCLYYNTSS